MSLAPVSHHRSLFTSEISLPFLGYSSSQEKDCQLMSEGRPAQQVACSVSLHKAGSREVLLRQKDTGR